MKYPLFYYSLFEHLPIAVGILLFENEKDTTGMIEEIVKAGNERNRQKKLSKLANNVCCGLEANISVLTADIPSVTSPKNIDYLRLKELKSWLEHVDKMHAETGSVLSSNTNAEMKIAPLFDATAETWPVGIRAWVKGEVENKPVVFDVRIQAITSPNVTTLLFHAINQLRSEELKYSATVHHSDWPLLTMIDVGR